MTTEVTAKFYGKEFLYWTSSDTDRLEMLMDVTGQDMEWNAAIATRIRKLRKEMLEAYGVPSVDQ